MAMPGNFCWTTSSTNAPHTTSSNFAKGTPMLALADHRAAAESSALSVAMDSAFWPNIPYAVGVLIIFATLLSELKVVASLGRRNYLKRPSGLLGFILAAVAVVAVGLTLALWEPFRESRVFEILPVTPGAFGFFFAALAFMGLRRDSQTRPGRTGSDCPGVSVGGAALMAGGGRVGTTAIPPERDDTDGAAK